jgi:hypothetical protein
MRQKRAKSTFGMESRKMSQFFLNQQLDLFFCFLFEVKFCRVILKMSVQMEKDKIVLFIKLVIVITQQTINPWFAFRWGFNEKE